jgi:hypothetical protein
MNPLYPLLLCSSALPPVQLPSGRRCADHRRPPPASHASTRRLLHAPDPFSLLAVVPYVRHGFPRAPAGRHLIAAEESPPRSLRPLSLARTSTTQASTFRFFSSFANSRAPNPNSTAAFLLPLRQQSALPWAAATRHLSPPPTPVRASPIPYSCSSTPCCPPIAARVLSPTSAAVAAFGLTVGSSL